MLQALWNLYQGLISSKSEKSEARFNRTNIITVLLFCTVWTTLKTGTLDNITLSAWLAYAGNEGYKIYREKKLNLNQNKNDDERKQ